MPERPTDPTKAPHLAEPPAPTTPADSAPEASAPASPATTSTQPGAVASSPQPATPSSPSISPAATTPSADSTHARVPAADPIAGAPTDPATPPPALTSGDLTPPDPTQTATPPTLDPNNATPTAPTTTPPTPTPTSLDPTHTATLPTPDPNNPTPTHPVTTEPTPSPTTLDPTQVAVLPDATPYSSPSTPAYPHFTYAPHPDQQPPKPPRPPKSTAAAVLLNLTGLGLGYAYLRRRRYLAIALVVTAGLVTTAFLTNAAANPWLWRALTAAWLVVAAVHAAALGRRHLPATTKRPVIAGAAAVTLLVVAYLGYGVAGNAIYQAGVDAQKTGNCAAAVDKFATVTGPFELTLSENVAKAETGAEECAAYTSARDAQKSNNYDAAIKQYNLFEAKYPHSALHTLVYNNLAETYVNRTSHWQLPLTQATASNSGDILLMVLRLYPDAPAFDRVPKVMADLFDAASTAFRAGDFCNSVAMMYYFTRLNDARLADIAAAAKANHAKALYECGLAEVRNGAPSAVTDLESFLELYPQDPGVPQAKAALVTAKVEQANGVTLPVPPPLGDNSPGNIPVTFYNDSSGEMTILVAGPTAHEITLPPCAICPADYPPGAHGCPTYDGRPSIRLELTPATYYILIVETSVSESNSGSITPLVGYEHAECMYIERR